MSSKVLLTAEPIRFSITVKLYIGPGKSWGILRKGNLTLQGAETGAKLSRGVELDRYFG